MNKKIISISLYGISPVYLKGAIVNAELAPEIFPGWTMRYYCENKLDTDKLRELDCEIITKPDSRKHSGMFWRFLSAWDKEAERVIFRDCDSRLNVKEAMAIKAWEKSGLDAHTMNDHPHHCSLPLFGGMWGIKCGVLGTQLLRDAVRQCRRRQPRVADMYWLARRVYPIIKDSLLRHSSVDSKWPHVPFPPHPEYNGFVGQQYDEEGNPVWPKL